MSYSFFIRELQIGNRKLYEDIELSIKERGITVIEGNNGCGKTTLLNNILYENADSVLLIAQVNDLIFDDRSIADNIMLFNHDEKRLIELLKSFNMEYMLERQPQLLSGGEKRIVSILRLFFAEKDIVMLDEPTNDLDYNCVEKICEIIKNLSKEKAVLIVTHDDRVSKIADCVYSMSDGKIISQSSIEEDKKLLGKKTFAPRLDNFFKKDGIGNILFALIILAVLCSEIAYFSLKTEKISSISENQTNIASKRYGNLDALIEQGYLPLNVYLAYDGKLDADFMRLYNQNIEELSLSGTSDNLFLDYKSGESVFLGCIWNPADNEKIYPLAEYQSLYEMLNGTKLNLSSQLTIYDGIEEIAEINHDGADASIDEELFRKLENAYFENYPELQPILYIVLNLDNSEVMKSEENWLVKNNTTIDICNKINAKEQIKNFIIILVLSLSASVMAYTIDFLMGLKKAKKHVVVCRNFGIPQKQVMDTVFKKISSPGLKAILLLLGIAANVILLVLKKEKLLFEIIFILMIIAYFSIIGISGKIIGNYINKIYSFGGIYEN